MTEHAHSTPLFHGETETAWHRFGTQDFKDLMDTNPLCILPVTGLKESSEGAPMDRDERLCGQYLSRITPHIPLVVLPPIRQLPLQEQGQVFTVDLETACQLVESTVTSACRTGVTRFCLLHAGEAQTDWLDGVGRDIRVQTGAKMYRIGLHALGPCEKGIPSDAQVASFSELLTAICSHGSAS